MYALIYDDHELNESQKKVISVHETREESEKALSQRQIELGKRVYECNTRIVWIEEDIKAGEYVSPGQYATWRPGEDVPHGEMYSDED